MENTADKSYSQFGEDIIIREYFKNIGIDKGVFIEAGAYDPFNLSQTCLLENSGWSGILVEPMPEAAQRCRENRPNSNVFECALGSVSSDDKVAMVIPDADSQATLDVESEIEGRTIQVEIKKLDDILDQAGITKVNFFALDVEGFEIDAMQGFDFEKHDPDLILIEDHVHDLTRDCYLKRKGYRCVKRTGCNNWYIKKGKPFTMSSLKVRWEVIRKLYLGLPFRKLRIAVKGS